MAGVSLLFFASTGVTSTQSSPETFKRCDPIDEFQRVGGRTIIATQISEGVAAVLGDTRLN
jgi:hypothetical protein